jgi:general secretion pathway protein D
MKPVTRRFALIVSLLLALSSAKAQVGPSFSLAVPRSESKAVRLIEDLAVHLVLTLGYTESSSAARVWRTEGLASLRGPRYFILQVPQIGTKTVELAYRRTSAGDMELHAYGQQFDLQGNAYTNPDLSGLQTRATTHIAAAAAPPSGPDDYGYEIYQLSYLQVDRVIATLKSLGYTTIEYSASAGETINDRVYNSYMSGTWKLPAIVKMIDATKTSLMDPPPAGSYPQQQQGGYSSATTLGGTFLHQMTSGEPQQRIMIVYDKDHPEPLQNLLNLLRQKLDQPARQIVIEALVIEVNTDKVKQLGLEFHSGDGDYSTGFGIDASTPGFGTRTAQPFSFQIFRNALTDVMTLRLRLTGLLESGDAEILSSPSVLVLDGRQARIQIGQQVPVSKSVSTTAGFASGVEYIQTGIVLNLRPRVSEDGSEISMQVETIVSAVNEALSIEETAQNILLAPRIDNRSVQTFVRVADNTSFIIGGLISTDRREKTTGIPILSQIPILGLPFRRKSTDVIKREVIIVLTPHVVPVGEKSFSYVIPKDSEMFNAFGNLLFRNAYRLRDDDIFDLKFLYKSDIFQSLLSTLQIQADAQPGFAQEEPFASLLSGAVPGEGIIVRRMLWEIAIKTGFGENIEANRIIVFEDDATAADSSGFKTRFLHQLLEVRDSRGENSLVLKFDASNKGTAKHPFVPPKASISYESVGSSDIYVNRLMHGNRRKDDGAPNEWTLLLSDVKPTGVRGASALQVLQGVLVLKRILALNTTLPLTIQEFRVGRQIIFPTEQDLKQRFHIVDRDAAMFFYEVIQYYPEFEKSFNRETQRITSLLGARR